MRRLEALTRCSAVLVVGGKDIPIVARPGQVFELDDKTADALLEALPGLFVEMAKGAVTGARTRQVVKTVHKPAAKKVKKA